MIRRIALGLALLAPLAAGREFTGRNGRTIDAEIVSRTATEVELRLAEDGKLVTVPISSLSDSDQLYVQTWESEEQKQQRLRAIEPAEVLLARGYVGFPVESKEGLTIVVAQLAGKPARLLVDHRNPKPVLHDGALERLGLTMTAVEGGGQVKGTVTPETIGNGSETMKGVEFYVATLQLPEGVDGIIGGQTFVDLGALLDFANQRLWLKNG